MNDNSKELLELIAKYPDLPVIPLVDDEVVGDDSCGWWLGRWGRCEVTKYFVGRERVHLLDDDDEDILNDMPGCQYGMTADGRDIMDLTDDEWNYLLELVPWVDAIVVHIIT